ncbi:MAG: RNA polymerase sporulation sigma factor SigK [Clostridia bacterium]|nr:RNA polymerase sporulation sigma factor SigK [Clostridia bacterium]
MNNAAYIALNYIYLLLGVSNGQCFPPPLSKKEETEEFYKMAEGDDRARTRLIEHNLRLVAHIVRKYYSTQKNQEDLISIGSIGLIKAIDSFKFENGARFATYAAKCIQNEILMYFRSQKKLQSEISINETIDVDRDGNPLTYIDIISVEDTIAEDIDKKLHAKRAMELIRSILTGRERQIIVLRFGLDGNEPLTQREVAGRLGISRSYVSRIEKAALEKLYRQIET